MTDARAIIAKVRDKDALTRDELRWFTAGLASGDVTAAQAGAFAMAVVLNGLGQAGRVALTEGMRDSGDTLRWDVPGPVVDKHSTGGIGDAVSLIVAPMLAACGVYVPMISGRGLGHTGGTLDKLDSIAGYHSEVSEEQFGKVVRDTGLCIAGPTGRLAPADKRLYAVRDVTATVESIDLITASILSKKLSAGCDALVMDVKCGSGAFMKTPEAASELAQALVETGNGAGCKTCAVISDMAQPLAPVAGNALEIAAVLRVLRGEGGADRMVELSCVLGEAVLAKVGVTEGASRLRAALASGQAAERFGKMVAGMGGPHDIIENGLNRLPVAPVVVEVMAQDDGVISSIEADTLGEAVVHLGGGRLREDDTVNPSVGLTDLAAIGQAVDRKTPIARVHAANAETATAAAQTVAKAYRVAEAAAPLPLVIQEVG